MPHQKLRAARKKVEGAKAKGAETKRRAKSDVRRAGRAIAKRTAPVQEEARQTRREAGLLARELGAGRVRSGVSSARERLAGIDLGSPDAENGALEQIALLEEQSFGGEASDVIGPSIDREILDMDGRVDIGDEMDPDSMLDDLEDRF